MICLSVNFLALILLGVLRTSQNCALVADANLKTFTVITASDIVSLSFSYLPLVFSICIYYIICNSCSTVTGYSVLLFIFFFLFSLFFLLAFQFWKFLLSCLQTQRFFLSCVQFIHGHNWRKYYSFLLQCLFSLIFLFYPFLKFYLSA